MGKRTISRNDNILAYTKFGRGIARGLTRFAIGDFILPKCKNFLMGDLVEVLHSPERTERAIIYSIRKHKKGYSEYGCLAYNKKFHISKLIYYPSSKLKMYVTYNESMENNAC